MLRTRLTDEELFRKYANGAIPPLVHPSDPRLGLIDYDLLEVYQRGFGEVHDVPLGVLLAKGSDQTASEEKWRDGDFCYNQLAMADWTHLCRLIRSNAQANVACEKCDRDYAMLAEKAGQAMAYLAPDGLVHFVVPVKVKAQTVAVLWSGQLLPAEGAVWPSGLVHVEAGAETAFEGRINLRALSNLLFQRSNDLGICQADIEQAITKDLQANRPAVGPDSVKRMLSNLDTAATHLSALATNAFDSEKSRLTGLVEAEVSRAVGYLRQDLSKWPDAIDALRYSLNRSLNVLGLGFAALCRVRVPAHLEVITHIGFDVSVLPIETLLVHLTQMQSSEVHWRKPQMRIIPTADASNLAGEEVLKLARHRDSSGFEFLIIMPHETPEFALLLGHQFPGRFAAMSDTDVEFMLRIASHAGISCETLFLLKDLRDSNEAMDRFLEDVAHDIRAPIQAILTKVHLLKQTSLDQTEYVRQASRLAAAVMRINLVAGRVWTVQRLRKGAPVSRNTAVRVSEIVAKVVDTLADISERMGVEILPEKSTLERLATIHVDNDLFFEALMNLVDNAVKYSTHTMGPRRPQVIIKGWQDVDAVVVSVGNRGIQIRDEDASLIFNRYYRSSEARRLRPDGSGIGLVIVESFAKLCGGKVEVASKSIPGTIDFLTIFNLHIPNLKRP